MFIIGVIIVAIIIIACGAKGLESIPNNQLHTTYNPDIDVDNYVLRYGRLWHKDTHENRQRCWNGKLY